MAAVAAFVFEQWRDTIYYRARLSPNEMAIILAPAPVPRASVGDQPRGGSSGVRRSLWPASPLKRHPAVRLALVAVAFRLASALLAFVVNLVFPLHQPEQFTVFGVTSPFWDAFARYDSGWYYQIARYGYHYTPDGRDSIAWFPVYPMLMRYVGRLFGRHPADFYMGGIVVSWLAFVVAMIALDSLARLDLPARRAERAPLLAAIFPFAFFYGVVYSEATFLASTIAAFYFMRTRRWAAAGLCGAVATATRVNGIVMVPALAWIAWRSAEPNTRDRLGAAASVALVSAGFGLYCAYIYHLTGNPFEWAATISRWGYYPGGAPWMAPVHLVQSLATHPYRFLAGERLAPYDTLNGSMALLFAASVPFVWRRFGAGYALFVLANLWLPLSSGQFEGMGRYCAVMFPVFIWLASIRSRTVSTLLVVACAMLYTLCLALFTTLHPIF